LRITVQALMEILEEIASFGLAETWDNVGLMVGDPEQDISGILIALDPTEALLAEAAEAGINTLVTHHPLIFHPLKTVRTDQAVGRFLQRALADRMTVIGCHTNLDLAGGGVNDVLANTVGLSDIKPLTHRSPAIGEKDSPLPAGFGRWGRLKPPMGGEDFLRHLLKVLSASALAVAGPLPATISTVAVCGGSGSELAEAAYLKGVQVYVTGEIKHSTARWAEACDFCVIDAGHFATENPVVRALAVVLQKIIAEKNWNLKVVTATHQHDPFRYFQA
jgi:dinuclear metal center YbgI/SA1388 family protein